MVTRAEKSVREAGACIPRVGYWLDVSVHGGGGGDGESGTSGEGCLGCDVRRRTVERAQAGLVDLTDRT